ncbi:hypothetical protein L207DRAFT_562586 [Hyaloscypha variabilis F]|uniref:Uncharacterized protein n=1 Tax=Hyaloscypha variabilis (strain UAMH 11265 / GT02V1 / F) TaxID=1149755 RepID=A0A2J6S3N9_HYAVF|nr:hypothetical protein L207DRAFT_562586 [Hyaloscypha variabilis F]
MQDISVGAHASNLLAGCVQSSGGLGNATIGGLRIPDPGEMRMTRKRPSLVLGFLALGARAVKHCRPAEQPGDGETTRRSALGCSTREINLAAASASCTFPLRRSTRLEPRLSWLSLFIFPSDIDRLRWRKVAEDEMFENASTAKVKAGGPCSLLHFALREDHLQNLCSESWAVCLLNPPKSNMVQDRGNPPSLPIRKGSAIVDRSCSRKHSSKKSSSTKHSSTSRSKSSSTKSSSKSQVPSGSKTHSTNSSKSSHTYSPSQPLVYYIQDPTHSNPGYSSAYTTALTYTYGFPQGPDAREEMEHEIVAESQARVQGNIDGYERQTGNHRQ